MVKTAAVLVSTWACSMGFCSLAHADGFRCPGSGRLVQDGDTMAEVEAKCGRPKTREDLYGPSCTSENDCVSVKMGELWMYDLGRNSLTRRLFFAGNILKAIDYGRYGE